MLIGCPVANRNRAEIERLVGFLVNTLILRADLSGNPSVREFLRRMREVCLDAYAHQDLPLERLVNELRPERDASRNSVFQVMFALQNTPQEALDLPGLQLRPVALEPASAQVDLTLMMKETLTGIAGSVVYATDLFDAVTIERWVGHYIKLLEGMTAMPDAVVSDLPLLTSVERERMLVECNRTARAYPRESGIHELFEEQARRTPEAVAVEFEDGRMSYGELNACANRLAHYLRDAGVGPEVPVGLLMDRSAAAVVGMLGVLKAGGAYVPLDPAYPAERLAFMVADTGAPVVVTRSDLLDRLPDDAAHFVCLDRDGPMIEGGSTENPDAGVQAENLAYVIYTSGSTGMPKGVQVTHRAISRLVCNTDYVNVGPQDRIAQVSVISFDAATFEIWGALLNGARVVGDFARGVARPAGVFAASA